MFSKVATIAAIAALAEQAAAFNSHRHLHNVDKRALEIDWVTVWETVYVTAGQESADPTTTEPVIEITTNVPTVYSTSTVVVPATTSQPPAAVPAAPEPVDPATVPLVSIAPSPVEIAPVEEAAATQPAATQPPVVNNPIVEEPAPVEEEQETETEEPETPAPSGGAPFSKRGLAYNDPLLAQTFGSSCKSCGWTYNWGSSSFGLESSMNYIPMLWGDAEMHTGHWVEDADAAIASGSKAVLSFNEPDHATQANMDPGRAAAAHAKFMNPYSGKALVGAPAVTNSGNAGEGLEWLQAFFDACDAQPEGCSVDFCPVHWYSEAQYSDTLFTHIEKAHEICGNRPIWLTEFAPLGSGPQIDEFMTNVIPQLDAIDYLHAYSYFMVSVGNLMSSPSQLSSFGQLYATV